MANRQMDVLTDGRAARRTWTCRQMDVQTCGQNIENGETFRMMDIQTESIKLKYPKNLFEGYNLNKIRNLQNNKEQNLGKITISQKDQRSIFT